LRLLAKQADHRFQSAGEFCTALESLGEDGQPRPASASLSASRLVNYDELATTTEDLPAVRMPEVSFTDEDRRQEIDELRASMGLHIEEPALDSQEEAQMSALAIDLGAFQSSTSDTNPQSKSERHALPISPAGPKFRLSSRPVEERQYVPPLAAPSVRASGQSRTTMEVLARRPSVLWEIIRAAVVLALFIAATVVAVKFIK
jgi:hypothetical protein